MHNLAQDQTHKGEKDISLSTSKQDRPYVLMTVKQLQVVYLTAQKETPPAAQGTKKLIEMLVGNKKHVGRTGKNNSDSLEQELTNDVISKMALKPLQGDTKRYYQKRHDLEGTYTNHLMCDSLNNNFPFGKYNRYQRSGQYKKLSSHILKILLTE